LQATHFCILHSDSCIPILDITSFHIAFNAPIISPQGDKFNYRFVTTNDVLLNLGIWEFRIQETEYRRGFSLDDRKLLLREIVIFKSEENIV